MAKKSEVAEVAVTAPVAEVKSPKSKKPVVLKPQTDGDKSPLTVTQVKAVGAFGKALVSALKALESDLGTATVVPVELAKVKYVKATDADKAEWAKVNNKPVSEAPDNIKTWSAPVTRDLATVEGLVSPFAIPAYSEDVDFKGTGAKSWFHNSTANRFKTPNVSGEVAWSIFTIIRETEALGHLLNGTNPQPEGKPSARKAELSKVNAEKAELAAKFAEEKAVNEAFAIYVDSISGGKAYSSNRIAEAKAILVKAGKIAG